MMMLLMGAADAPSACDYNIYGIKVSRGKRIDRQIYIYIYMVWLHMRRNATEGAYSYDRIARWVEIKCGENMLVKLVCIQIMNFGDETPSLIFLFHEYTSTSIKVYTFYNSQ